MKISFNSLYGFPNSYDVVAGQLSLCKIIYTVNKAFDIYSEISKDYIQKEIPTEDEAKLAVKHYLKDIFDEVDVGEINVIREGCEKISELLNAEVRVIQKHLNRHKWFQHIDDDNQAMVSFCEQYGWILKEMYCMHVCKLKGECKHSKELLNGEIEKTQEELSK